MDLRQLRYVTAIVESGTFTGAAKVLQVSQPALSQAVHNLEVELGAELFHRGPRRAVLSAAGEALLEPARQALRDASNAQQAVAAVVGLRAGRLDLVCLPTLAVHPTAQLVGSFRTAHPEVSVRILEPEDVDDAAESVRNGSSEIGLTELLPTMPGLTSHVLEIQEFVAVMPADPGVPQSTENCITIETLAAQPLITSPRGTSTRRQIEDAFGANGLQATVAVETDHREAIGSLVRAGAGVALLPRRVAQDLVGDGVTIAAVSPQIVRSVGLIRRDGALSPAARAFMDLAMSTTHQPVRPRPRRRTTR